MMLLETNRFVICLVSAYLAVAVVVGCYLALSNLYFDYLLRNIRAGVEP